MQQDWLFTCKEVAKKVGISPASAYQILLSHLGYRRIAAKWVPHMLIRPEANASKSCSSAVRLGMVGR